MVRRFVQQLRDRGPIAGFAFIPTPRRELKAREKELVRLGEMQGLTLLNVSLVSDFVSASVLEELLPSSVIERWLTCPIAENRSDLNATPIQFSDAQRARCERNLSRLQAHPLCRAAVVQLFLYLQSAVPYPRRTEHSFWSVSCMPSTNRQTWPRLLCISASRMELFCLGYYRDPQCSGAGWGFMNVASDVLFSAFGGTTGFTIAYPAVEVIRSDYKDGGPHQVRLETSTQNDMIALLRDESVTRAAATLCRRVMSLRSNIYSRHHCPQLVDLAMLFRECSAEDLGREADAVSLPAHRHSSIVPSLGDVVKAEAVSSRAYLLPVLKRAPKRRRAAVGKHRGDEKRKYWSDAKE